MDVSACSSNVNNIPVVMTQAQTDMQAKLLAAAAQKVQAIPMDTLQQVLSLMGIGQNLDIEA